MTCFFLSAISLKRLNAVLSAWPETSKPSSSSALRSAWRPEYEDAWAEAYSIVAGAMLDGAAEVELAEAA